VISLGLNIWRCISSGGATLAPGALGVWYADTYQSTPRKVIPNAVAVTPPSLNLRAAPQRQFSETLLWTGVPPYTVVDEAAIGPDGLMSAATLYIGGGGYFNSNSLNVLPAGNYIVGVTVKSNSGSNEFFCFLDGVNGGLTPTQTATNSWQRFSYAFTAAAPFEALAIRLATINGATDANLQLYDFSIFSGSVDQGAETMAGHMYLGRGQGDSAAVCSGGELDLSATNAFALVQFPANVTASTGFTAQVTARQLNTAHANQTYFSKMRATSEFSAALSINSIVGSIVNGTTQNFAQFQSAGLWDLVSAGYHVFTLRHNGTTLDFWVDDVRLFTKTVSLAAINFRDFWIGFLGNPSLSCDLKINSQALYATAITDSQIRDNYQHFKARLALSSKSIGAVDYLVYEGDSITGQFANSYPFLQTFASPKLGVVLAIGGSNTANLVSRAATANAVVPPSKDGRKFHFSVLLGANDLGTVLDSTFLAGFEPYVTTSITSSFDNKLVCTITPRNVPVFNTRRNAVNAGLATWPGLGKCTGIVDFAADATIGPDAAGFDTAKYYDGTHTTTATGTAMAGIHSAVINAL